MGGDHVCSREFELGNPATDLTRALASLAANSADVWKLDACGVTRSQTRIETLIHRDAYVTDTGRTRILLVGGLSGQPDDVDLALEALKHYADAGERLTSAIALSAVPCGNPDGLAEGAGPGNGVGGRPSAGYPPVDGYFNDESNPEARYLWRWVCFQGPDIVLEVRAGSSVVWEASNAASHVASTLGAAALVPADSLLGALSSGQPSGLAPIPGLRLTAPTAALAAELERMWALLAGAAGRMRSPARRVLEARRARTPLKVARALGAVYGHKLDPVVYTQGVAISGRLRLAGLDDSGEDPVPGIVELVEPYVSGTRQMFQDEPGTASLAGLLWADEQAEVTGDRRYADLVVGVAGRYRPADSGRAPPPCDPDFRTEDMFMSGAMLGRAYGITGDGRYLDILTRFLLDAEVQQEDGLFWHCRSAPYYWGRGNGFAAMGFAETLTFLLEGHPRRDAILTTHLKHLKALRELQQPSGMYLQVLDFPGSYQELTSTCMVGYAMARGIRRGWLDLSYRASVELAWRGVCERIGNDGRLVDPCTNTGVQSDLRGYLGRPAIFGLDDRGGAMALWFATELEQLRREVG